MSSGEDSGERNPFAPPPPGAPDQPWRPRVPQSPSGERPDGSPEGDGPQPPQWGPRPEPGPQGPRLDLADPTHRTARNALLSGFGALLTTLFGLFWIGFPLSLLAVWYAVAVLRVPAEPVTDPFASRPVRPQVPAALSALLTGGLALAMSLATFALQFTYHDYLDCVNSAITKEGVQSCGTDVPKWVTTIYEGPAE
ncbi:hypothetical protein ACFV4P_21630 [Kitasatospora sp. NPDC059795]|uniref:hypothetical protein n=1 Tax=unclassified Kitasatospora TaxID=2633591 RepID=UPI000940553C|nr:hypothetical protein [Kitasatospora sp. CB01950]